MGKIDDIINHTANLKVPEGRSKDEIWAELQQKIENETKKEKKQIIKQPVFYYSIASSIIIFFSVFLFINYNSKTEFIIDAGQNKSIFLPDGSEVIINSVSELSFSENNWKKNRIVHLEGEAFFKVKKGSKFTVNCLNGAVNVKGTIFNVFSRNNKLKVKCTEGSVSVKYKSAKEILIKENQGISFDSNYKNSEIFSLNKSHTNLWTKGQFYFENTELEEVFKEMERQFNIKIQFKSKTERFFNGYFNNKDLNQALKMVCKPMNMEYEFKNESLVVITAP